MTHSGACWLTCPFPPWCRKLYFCRAMLLVFVCPVFHQRCLFSSPMFLHQLLRSWASFLLDLIILMLNGQTRSQGCSCLAHPWIFSDNNLGLHLWPAIWNCFMNHITKNLVFLLLFFTVSWGHLFSLLMFLVFQLPQIEAFISLGNSFYVLWETVYFLRLWYM